jgi:two-component system capsular synthesis sensor histidine kinase RcsC
MKHRVLVVEDEAAIASTFSEYLSDIGFDVDCTDNTDEALALADRNEYAVLLSDLRLKQMGIQAGFEFIKTMHQRHPETAVAVLSGALGSDETASVEKMGARVVLRKPKPLSELGQIVMGLSASFPQSQADPVVPNGIEIARMVAQGSTDAEIARTFNTNQDTIRDIRSDWFHAMPPRKRLAVCLELARRSEMTQ